jgi:hypothetical protein
VHHLKTQNRIAAFFSFWAGSGSQRKLIDLLRTILWHLLQAVPDDTVRDISGPLVKALPLDIDNLRAAIEAAIKIIPSDVYCVIDGIDESLDDWTLHRDGCLKVILDLARDHPNLHFLLVGREPSMLAALKVAAKSLEITESLVKGDIDKLISFELNHIPNIESESLKQEVRDTLQANSDIMFLWVTLIFKGLKRCFTASEIKHNLRKIPRDLDREYHRLFAQLQDRTCGTSSNPSSSMSRSKRLLSIIIATPEPLTFSELHYAYAVQVNPSQSYTDELLAKDAIIDACGDLVREADGHYHIVHATVAEFLTRPTSDWLLDDQDIHFFQIDPLEAQRSMCFACLDYLGFLELGYPLTEKSLDLLPTRFPFFSYAVTYLPFHVLQACSEGAGSLLKPKIESFLVSVQFCALIEYMFLAVVEESENIVYPYFDLVQTSSSELAEVLSSIDLKINPMEIFVKESLRRQMQFGQEDPRTESWDSFSGVLAMVWHGENDESDRPGQSDKEHESEHFRSISSDSTPPNRNKSIENGIVTRTSSSISNLLAGLPHIVAHEHHVGLIGISKAALSTSITQHLGTILSKLPSLERFLPPHLLMLWAYRIEGGIRESPYKIRQARRLISIAMDKLRDGQNYWGALCLHYMAFLTDRGSEDEYSVDLLNQSLAISQRLPRLPHVESLIHDSIGLLTETLMRLERHDAAMDMVRQLEIRINESGSANVVGTRWARAIYDGDTWARMKLINMTWVAHTLYYEYFDVDADRILRSAFSDFGMPRLERLRNKPSAFSVFYSRLGGLPSVFPHLDQRHFYNDIREAFFLHERILGDMHKYEEAESVCRLCLKTLPKQTYGYHPKGIVADLCIWLLRQGKLEEARQWMLSFDIDLASSTTVTDSEKYRDYTYDMEDFGAIFLIWGDYERAAKVYRALIATAGKQRPIGAAKIENLEGLSQELTSLGSNGDVQNALFECLELWRVAVPSDDDDELAWWIDRVNILWSWQSSGVPEVWDVVLLRSIDLAQTRHGFLSSRYLYPHLAARYAACRNLQAAATVCAEMMRWELLRPGLETSLFAALESGARMLLDRGYHAKGLLVCRSIEWTNLGPGDHLYEHHFRLAYVYIISASNVARTQPAKSIPFLIEARKHSQAADKLSELPLDPFEVKGTFKLLKELLKAFNLELPPTGVDQEGIFEPAFSLEALRSPQIRRVRSLSDLTKVKTESSDETWETESSDEMWESE